MSFNNNNNNNNNNKHLSLTIVFRMSQRSCFATNEIVMGSLISDVSKFNSCLVYTARVWCIESAVDGPLRFLIIIIIIIIIIIDTDNSMQTWSCSEASERQHGLFLARELHNPENVCNIFRRPP
jgi:hypothetical protein